MSLRAMSGLSLDQAPPLSVVFPFFLAGAAGLFAAGALLACSGAQALQTQWSPVTLGLTHLTTLGFLTPVMMGALYQMIPVLLGAPVRAVRTSHVVLLSMGAGITLFAAGLVLARPRWVGLSLWPLALGLVLFLVPALVATVGADAKGQTARGIRLALVSLVAVGALGLSMALGHAGSSFPGDRASLIRVHLTLGVLGWIGSLLVAVSWQVLPMFYLAEEVRPGWQRAVSLLIAVGVLLPPSALLLPPDLRGAALRYGPAPALTAIFFVHPLLTLRSLKRRRRKRAHASMRFFQAGLALAPLALVAGIIASYSPDPRWALLSGTLALFGWAGLIMHGMLTRIVPFLVWFHRFSPLAGDVPIPSMNALLPARWIHIGLALHVSAVIVSMFGIATRSDVALRLAGGLISLTACGVASFILRVVARRPTSSRNTQTAVP